MFILNFLISLMLILILIVMVCTVIKFSMMIVVRYNYNNNILVLPSIFNILLWTFLLFMWYSIVVKILKIDVFTMIFNDILNIQNSNIDLIPVIFITLGIAIIGIVAQAFCYMLINFCYKDHFGRVRMNISELLKKLFKKENEKNSLEENTICEYISIPKIDIKTALIASTFTFATLICVFLLLFFIGTAISSKIIPS